MSIIGLLRQAFARSIHVEFDHGGYTVATVRDISWWRPTEVYTVALYAESLWVRDDTNKSVRDGTVIDALDAAAARWREDRRHGKS